MGHKVMLPLSQIDLSARHLYEISFHYVRI